MISELAIKNFAIIDDITICFSGGLTVLSGETGAGKSIIVNAVNLLLGSRANAGMIRTGAESAEITALFHLKADSPAREILAAHDFDPADDLVIRRVIFRNDRHRVYINDRLSTMLLMGNVARQLAAISGQHEYQRMLDENRHLFILDDFSGLTPLRSDFKQCYRRIIPLITELARLHESLEQQQEQIELLKFQQAEIEDAGITPGEDEDLRQELARLKHAEMLHQTARCAVETLYSGEGAVIDRLGEIVKELEKAARIDSTLSAENTELADAAYKIEDTAGRLRIYADRLEFDEARIEQIESRMDRLNRLKRKYGGRLEAVLDHLADITVQLEGLENLFEKMADIEGQLREKHQELAALAGKLSSRRREAAAGFSKRISEELKSLRMPRTRIKVVFEDHPVRQASQFLTVDGKPVAESGAEQVRLLIAPNVGEEVKPLSEIASGGELSRVILAIKSIMADKGDTATMIFDEVDAGIGGETAEVVGRKLADLSAWSQVICITHQAQIAKFAQHHFKIEKQVEKGRTCTRITLLDEVQRLEETARMIGGADITPVTRDHAREMLETARQPASKSRVN